MIIIYIYRILLLRCTLTGCRAVLAMPQDLSDSAPSTVGWPEAMGITREHDSRLSLNELVT